MATRDRELIEALLKAAGRLNVEAVRIEVGGKHPSLTGVLDGRPLRFSFAGTTGSKRTFQNTLCNFRNLIRKQWPEVAATAFAKTADGATQLTKWPRTHRPVRPITTRPPKRSPEPQTTIEDRFYAPLEQLRARLLAAAPQTTAA